MHVEPVPRRSAIPQTSGNETSNSWNEAPVWPFARGS